MKGNEPQSRVVKRNKRKAQRQLKHLKLIVFDFDGVLTDNKVIVHDDGHEAVVCSRGDGLGFDILRAAKIPCLILSKEANKVVSMRAKKLKAPCIQAIENKTAALKKFCSVRKIQLKNVMYVGNDLNDLEVMQVVGWPICPADSHPKIKAVSRKILRAVGGAGVVREITAKLLKLE